MNKEYEMRRTLGGYEIETKWREDLENYQYKITSTIALNKVETINDFVESLPRFTRSLVRRVLKERCRTLNGVEFVNGRIKEKSL